ncbi:MAG: hypothetical protein CV090_02735 [Nitrospira sp. WS238]|nr:hypothetical protein [Nitrospira sp. WS238]
MEQAPSTESVEVVYVDASFEPLVPKFLTNRKKEVLTMRDALASQGFETIRTVAHGMKGACANYGGPCQRTGRRYRASRQNAQLFYY